MITLTETDTAFILMEATAMFMVGGMLWYTRPYRKRGHIEDKLFFVLEIFCIIGFLSDISFFLMDLETRFPEEVTLDVAFYEIVSRIFDSAHKFFLPFLVLYASCFLIGDIKILKRIAIPIILVLVLQLIATHSLPFVPYKMQMFLIKFNISVILYAIYRVAALILIFLVDKKLFFYYFLAVIMSLVLRRILPDAQTEVVFDTLVLVFAHIIVVNREFTEEKEKHPFYE